MHDVRGRVGVGGPLTGQSVSRAVERQRRAKAGDVGGEGDARADQGVAVSRAGRQRLQAQAEHVERLKLEIDGLADIGVRQIVFEHGAVEPREGRAAGMGGRRRRIKPTLQPREGVGVGPGQRGAFIGHEFAIDHRQRRAGLRARQAGAAQRRAALRQIDGQSVGRIPAAGAGEARRQHALPQRRGDRADLRIGRIVQAQPDIRAAPIGIDDAARAAGRAEPKLGDAAGQGGRRFVDQRRVDRLGRDAAIHRVRGRRAHGVEHGGRDADRELLGLDLQMAGFVFLDRNDADGERGNAEIGIRDFDDVHRLEQAIFPREREREMLADVELPLQQRLRDDRPDVEFIADFMRGDRRADARAVEFDLRLVARLDGDRGVLVRARAAFDALDVRQRVGIQTRNLHGVIVAAGVDEIFVGQGVDRREVRVEAVGARVVEDDLDGGAGVARVEQIGAVGRDRILADAGGRAGAADIGHGDVAQRVFHAAVAYPFARAADDDFRRAAHRRGRDRRRRDGGKVRAARNRRVGVGDELELASRPDRGAIADLQPAREDGRGLFLRRQDRREGEAERPAIGLQARIAAGPEQRGRVDRRRREARAILRIGQEILDDERRVGVDAVDARPPQIAEDFEIVVADAGGLAELVTRRADIGRPLVGDCLGGII